MKLHFSDYLALPHWSSHSLKAMRRGPPARVIFERDHPREETRDTARGRAAHCALLEPDSYLDLFAHRPEGLTLRNKEGQKWRDEQGKKTILTAEDGHAVEGIIAALTAKAPVIESLRNATHREDSFIWDCPLSGEPCKGRPDWISGGYVYDLKVSRHAETRWLHYRAFEEGWMHQVAHYRTGLRALGLDVNGARLVVVTPNAPHLVYTLEVRASALDDLEAENIATLRAMRACRLANDWPGTPDTWELTSPPASAVPAFGDLEDEEPDVA